MADQIAGVGADGIARVRDGQDFTLILQITANGVVQPLAGRTFALSFRDSRKSTPIIDPVILTASDGTDQLPLTATAADTPAIVAGLRSVGGVCEASEVFAGSARTLVSFPTSVSEAVALSIANAVGQDAPGTLVRYDVVAGTVSVSQMGPMGWSAAQQVARAVPDELTDTTDAAFTAWLVAKAAAAAAGAISDAQAATTAATTQAGYAKDQGDYAKAQGAAAKAVVDQQTTTLSQVSQAKTDAQSARDAAAGSETAASGSAGTAAGAATATAADRTATGQDRTATGQDRTQTGLDRTATGQDRTQTGLDRTAADGSATAAAGSATAAAGSATAAAGSATSTAADRAQTGADRAQTNLDRTAVSTTANTGVGKVLPTWAALSAITGANNDGAIVPDTDTGTHTDPVTGGTVPNAGTFRYVAAAPAGWQWISNSTAAQVAASAKAAAASAALLGTANPLLASWLDFTVDAAGRFVRGQQSDGSRWQARAGVITQIAPEPPLVNGVATYPALTVTGLLTAPGLSVAQPTIGFWKDLVLDSTNRIVSATRFDGTQFTAQGGLLVQVAKDYSVVAGVPTFATLATTGGITSGGPVTAPNIASAYPTIGAWKDLVVDSTGRIVSATRLDGTAYTAIGGVLVAAATTAPAVAHPWAYDYNTGFALPTDATTDYLVMLNGQSWAVGAIPSGQTGDATVTTTAQWPGNALMFNVGAQPSGAAVTGYVDLKEQTTSQSYETACSGMADFIMSAIQARLGAGSLPRMVFCVAALGGNAYFDNRGASYGLKPGTATYAESVRLVQRATDISKAAGRKLVVLAQVIIHGEQDFSNGTPKALYQRALDQWRAHFDEDVKRITGQSEPVRMYTTQVNRGGTSIGQPAAPALAQLAAQDRNPLIRCVGPIYQGPGGADGAHMLARGYRGIGRTVGKFVVEDLFGPYLEPLRVIEAYWVSSTLARLRYSMPIALETGDTLVNVSGLPAGRGVDFTDGSGSPPTVTGIAITSGTTDTLDVTLSGPPAGKRPQIFVACLRAGGGSGSGIGGYAGGARSAIRSASAFDTDALTGVTTYHWACQEQLALPTI